VLSLALMPPVPAPLYKPTVSPQQMLGMVCHDLRTPLQAVSMAAELLSRRQHCDDTLRLLGTISDSVARAQRLVADLLDYTLLQEGRGIALHPVLCDLSEAVARCVEELRLTCPDYPLIHLHLGERSALFDKDRLHQAVGNLVANAVAYGERGAPIQVTSRSYGRAATVSVHNWGVPIPSELLGRLFEPLVRGQQRAAKAGSIGLGLFIVRQIAQAHAGEVSVTSTEQAGTTFCITLAMPVPQ